MGDGVKSFVGVVCAVGAMGQKFILIDDPEAYLHPPIARVLGSSLVELAEERNAQLIVTTHSADFLLGCVESSDTATIVRLTYDYNSGAATARQIEPSTLRKVLQDGLLRSTGVFDGLFHHAVVVTESENDRAVYDDINRRLLDVDRGLKDTLFLSAQNWQTTGRVARPLRDIGVPTSVIVDIDTLTAKAAAWGDILNSCQVSEEVRNSMSEPRTAILDEFSPDEKEDVIKVKRGEFKRAGKEYLTDDTRLKLEKVIVNLTQYGVFIVPVGELEGWLPSLQIMARKSKFVREYFEIADSLIPGDDDVWLFIDQIASWVGDENR